MTGTTPASQRPPLTWRKKVVFGAVTAALVLGLVEIVFRLVASEPTASAVLATDADRRVWPPEEIAILKDDPVLAWRNRPSVDARHRGVAVRTNRRGLRDGPVPDEKPEETYRILSLGESSTFGVAVPAEVTYSAVLERCLNARRHDACYEVINGGVIAYSLVS